MNELKKSLDGRLEYIKIENKVMEFRLPNLCRVYAVLNMRSME